MNKKIIVSSFLISAFLFTFSSCGGGGGGGAAKAPEVIVSTDNTVDNPSETGDGSVTNPGSIIIDNGSGEGTEYVVIIPADNGFLEINNEYVRSDSYDNSSVSVHDENNNSVSVAIDESGDIKISPADGTVEGTYTVIITAGDREYLLVVTVDDKKNPVITTSISYPSGSSMIADLDQGKLIISENETETISSGDLNNYSLDSSVQSITVTDKNGASVSAAIDQVTGDIIADSAVDGPFNVVIVMTDGRVIIFQTDSTGAVTGNITVSGRAVMVDLDNGGLSSGGINLTLTENNGSGWSLAGNVEILSATAGDGTITVVSDRIKINTSNGDILITGGGSTVVPSGPYEVRVSVDGKEYVIKTDASGNITEVVPGNILLDLNSGYAVHSGSNIIKITSLSDGEWSISGSITSLQAVNSENNSVAVSIDSNTGDLRTTDSAAGEVTVTFFYTDSEGNIISYTIIVVNGNITSYMAEISEPGPDFDFSTVTNVRISLKVSDEKTGLPLGQASINLIKSDGALNWQGFTNNSGISVFTATVDSANKTAKISVTRTGYESVGCTIDGIGRLVEYGKNITMSPVEDVVVTDSDGDGVPDEDDEFPDDAEGAKQITGTYTLAFEDLYPDKGDADFNDLVVRLTIIEKIDSQNKLRRIDLKTKLLASGAGYTNQFWIKIYGKKYQLIANPKANSIYTLGSFYTNTNQKYKYVDCAEKTHDPVIFENGINRDSVAAMPYDPYIVCNGVTGKEVHLPFVDTDYTGKVIDSDGFPWGLLVPDDWSWPCEKGKIYNAYPDFDDWYLSSGTESADWYLRPSAEYVYQK